MHRKAEERRDTGSYGERVQRSEVRALAADTLGELPVVTTSLGGVDDLIANLTAATDRSRTTPSHVAVSEALKRRIALGGFSADERLPAERELAAVLGVGGNTIRRAVRELARQLASA